MSKLLEIRERLSKVQGKPWKYEPKHEMFIGTTNALNIYYDTLDLGRNCGRLVPSAKGYVKDPECAPHDARIKALGEFLETCREDIEYLLNLAESLGAGKAPFA